MHSVMSRRRIWPVLGCLMLLVALACGRRYVAKVTVLTLGDPCTEQSKCRPPLVCGASGVCEPSGEVPAGEGCVTGADCADGLRCNSQVCAPEGSGADGAICAASGDCSKSLRCSFEGLGGTCRPEGDTYLDESCSASGDCMAGLICDPTVSTCRSSGSNCTRDDDCAPDLGFFCLQDAEDETKFFCGGLGPDNQAVSIWPGASCDDSRAMHGDFRVLFEVADSTQGDFFRLPFPNDARIDADGTVDLTGFPRPAALFVPVEAMSRFVGAIESEQKGFGPNQGVFFRFSGEPKFCEKQCKDQDSSDPCWTSCMGATEQARSTYIVDLTRDDTGAFGPKPQTPVAYTWSATTGSTPYICGPWMALAPRPRTPWKTGHTYAVFVHSGLQGMDADNAVDMVQDADFAAMLAAASPTEDRLKTAYDAYEPLRAWLATTPKFDDNADDSHANDPIEATTIGGAAVFTIRDPTTTLDAIGAAVETHFASATDVVKSAAACDPTADETCGDPAQTGFVEIRGTLDLPIFQEGVPPYQEEDGGVVVDSSKAEAVLQRLESVRFALTVPASGTATMPGAGWPVVVYAHGTGGDYRSHITEDLAEALTVIDVSVDGAGLQGFAVLGIDQPVHGDRKAGSTRSSEALYFNLENPQAAKGNVLQGAGDQLSLIQSIAALSTALGSVTGAGGAALDAASIVFLGHSQGGTVGIVAMARAPVVGSAIFSGSGGGLIESLTTKQSPYDSLKMTRLLLADPLVPATDARLHPALSIIQGYMEDADPLNYGRLMTREPLGGTGPKHVLEFIGVGDTYTPNATAVALGRRLIVQFIDPDESLVEGPAAPPLRGNSSARTQVASVHEAASGTDGHFVMFEVEAAKERLRQFVGSAVTDAENVPTVVE